MKGAIAAGALASFLALFFALSEGAADGIAPGVLVERLACAANPQQSYALYLPSSYAPSRTWPILYCFDPRARGRVPVERFQAAAERYGYIVAGSNTSRNGIPVADIVRTLWDDTHIRFAVDGRRVYAAGFSGGARVASSIALSSPGLVAGVIAYGAGFPAGMRAGKDTPFVFLGGAGRDDFNLPEMRRLAAELDAAAIPNRLEVWEGGHEWAPAELCTLSVEWLELRAMRTGTRRKDEGLVEEWARRDAERARQRETAGDAIEAAAAFETLAEDFQGLRDTAAYAQAAVRLRNSRGYKDAARAQSEDDSRQAQLTDELGAAIQQLGDPENRFAGLSTLHASIADLKRRAEKANQAREAHVARRALGGAWVQALEASSALRERKEYRRAAETLAIAGEIKPSGAGQLYELARLYALGGDERQALRELQRAVAGGFTDVEKLLTDTDLDRIRRSPEFAELVERARAASVRP